ncbi:MAG: toprim domain-containing protein [Candidatus Baldrarchaeia archaeon]
MSQDKNLPVDVRIIVEGAADVEALSKAFQRLALGSQYNVTISAIIPTTNVDLAIKTVEGADVVLIATDADKPGRQLAERLKDALEGKVGILERMRLPIGHDIEHVNIDLLAKELENSIIRAGLKSLQQVKELHRYKKEIEEKERKINELEDLLERYKRELEELRSKKVERGYQAFKIEDLWAKIFPHEKIPDQIEDAINFLRMAPKIAASQGYIYAIDENTAIEALKVVYVAIKLAEQMTRARHPSSSETKETEPGKLEFI